MEEVSSPEGIGAQREAGARHDSDSRSGSNGSAASLPSAFLRRISTRPSASSSCFWHSRESARSNSKRQRGAWRSSSRKPMASLPPSRSIPSGSPNRDVLPPPAARQFPLAMKLPPFFEENRGTVDAALERLLPAATAQPSSIHTAMRYSVFAGGKRIRPILCLETARIFASDVTPALHPACAIEFIHTYSLIHDDLPALDNDDLRRGKPTCHKKFGEAIAILAGDALLTLAFDTIGATPASAERRAAILTEVAAAAGTINGMLGAQVADIEAEGKPIDPRMLEYIHRSKTPALLSASITAR